MSRSFRVGDRFWPEWFHDAVSQNKIITHGHGKFGTGEKYCEIVTSTHNIRVDEGNYIVKLSNGTFCECKAKFVETKHSTIEIV